MMRQRPPGEGRARRGPKMLAIAYAALLLASCATLTDALDNSPGKPHEHQTRHPAEPLAQINRQVAADDLDDAVREWAATTIQPGSIKSHPNRGREDSPESSRPRSSQDSSPERDYDHHNNRDYPIRNNYKKNIPSNNDKHDTNNIIHNDASALATLAPAKAVRAPPPGLRPGASSPTFGAGSGSGLASPQSARSLADWEVEDFVLLATVDGDLYAADRATGRERWRLEVEQPMITTTHHRSNVSSLEDDFHPVDHYIWAVEPGRDGGLYLWIPTAPEPTLVDTGLTMKKLVEELAPHAIDDPPVAYVGEKKTAMITLDADTGRVLKWFGTSGSQVNDAESCLRPNAIYDQEECSSAGTITLGRTEYTVGIQRRDGRPIATLRYTEWVLNTFDNDLLQQYDTPLDQWYITSQHDGGLYAFSRPAGLDHGEAMKPVLKNIFSTPVARVFDVCRPRGLSPENDRHSDLVILPQPPPPAPDAAGLYERRNSVYLNRTEDGAWYAMSGNSYPLIVNAPMARIQRPEWWELRQAIDSLTPEQFSSALVGTHQLDMVGAGGKHQPPTLPGGQLPAVADSETNESAYPELIDGPEWEPPTIGARVRTFRQRAADRVTAWVMNEVWIPIFVILIIVYHKELRRQTRRLATRRYWVEMGWFGQQGLMGDGDSDSESEDKVPGVPEEQNKPVEATPQPDAEPQERAEATAPQVGAAGEPPATNGVEGVAGPDEPPQSAVDQTETPLPDPPAAEAAPQPNEDTPVPVVKEKKKAHRGRRGGVKHRKKDKKSDQSSSAQQDENHSPQRSASPSRERERQRDRSPREDPVAAVNKVINLREPGKMEPDVQTLPDDMQSVAGPIIRMGNIEVDMNEQLGTGSNGTLVFSGKFDGRVVAVKRMLIQFYDIASQETRLLRESDDHPNVIRYFAQQVRDGFLYIALERCAASLADVVEKPHLFLELANAGRRDLPGVLLQITNGIAHLHSLRIVHRDLKPQNILVNMGKDGRPRLLVSDFGLCKKLEGGQSSFGATTGRAAGTSGWRAPELLLNDDAGPQDASIHSGSGSVLVTSHDMMPRRATRSIDIFSLGLVFFYVLTNGSHPFDCGDRYMREVNIRKGNYSLDALDSLGDFAFEAKDLVASMLAADPKDRPSAEEVMAHPFFWSAKTRLQFLCDVSDHFEKEPRDPPSEALKHLESYAEDVTCGDFLKYLPREFIDSLGKQRKYTGSRLLDLLRALRNKRNHYEDMPESLKRSLGGLPDGYLGFWAVRFPNLLLVCWNVVYQVGWDSADRFREYYEPVRT